ncbi:MAG: peptidylprolyl isomerase, partial [Balneolaceae bacterium]
MKSRFNSNRNSILSFLFLIFFTISIPDYSYGQLHSDEDIVIGQIGEEKIKLNELLSYYRNHSANNEITPENLREFLPYYVDYQLKLKEGIARNYDKDPDLIHELQNYSIQAAFSYWIENEVKERLFEEFKERSQYEIKSFHLLQRLGNNPSPSDTLNAYEKLLEAREQFLKGIPIEELDRQYSTQLSQQSAGGQLPWMTAGSAVKPFEDALYSTAPGEISEPVRTQFGYHLVYVQEKRLKTKDRNVRHIFFRNPESDEQINKSTEAFELLKNGADWDSVTVAFTEDGMSRNRGGQIGWIGYGMQYPDEFVDAVMNVEPELAFSEPVITNYGIHIFRIDSVRNYKSEELRNDELKRTLESLPHYNNSKELVHKEIAKHGNATVNEKNLRNL